MERGGPCWFLTPIMLAEADGSSGPIIFGGHLIESSLLVV